MKEEFVVKGMVYRFSGRDVISATSRVVSGGGGRRTQIRVKAQGGEYPARQIVRQMLRERGASVPDLTTYQAVSILRRLGFEIVD